MNINPYISYANQAYKVNGVDEYRNSVFERKTSRIPSRVAAHKVTIFKLNSRVETIKAVKAHWNETARERARRAAYVDMRYQCIILNADTTAKKLFSRRA